MIEVVAAAIIIKGKLLCFKKGDAKYEYLSNKFEFPGGKIENDETPVEALKRELIEEINMSVSIGPQIGIIEHDYPDFSIRMHCYICFSDFYDGTLNDHTAYEILKFDQLNSVEWIAADIPIKNMIEQSYKHVFEQ